MAFGWKERERCAEVWLLVGERERGCGGLWPGEPNRGHQADGSLSLSSVTEGWTRVELRWCVVGRWADAVEQPGHFRVVGYNYRVPFASWVAKIGSTRRKCGHRRVVAGVGQSDGVLGAWRTLKQKGTRFWPQRHRVYPILATGLKSKRRNIMKTVRIQQLHQFSTDNSSPAGTTNTGIIFQLHCTLKPR